MTTFAGEQLLVSMSAKDFDTTTTLQSTDVIDVEITIYDSAQNIVVDSQVMTFDSGSKQWRFLWSTDGLDAGSYRARVVLTGLDGEPSFEWKRIRLARNPITV